MNNERNIDDDLLSLWNRYRDTDKTTNRTKAIRHLETRFTDLEEMAKEDHGIIENIKRGILGIAGGFKRK